MAVRIRVSPESGKIYQGQTNQTGDVFVGKPKDVTSDVLRAVIEKAELHGGVFPIEADRARWEVRVTRVF